MADQPQTTQQPQSRHDAVPRSGQQMYRQPAYEQRGRVAPIDGVLRVSAPHEWLMLLVLAATVLAALAWSFFGRLESGVSGLCTVQTAGVRHAVAAPAAGVVVEVLAEPADHVEAGDLLARLAAPELTLAADLATARATALAAQHPGAPETAAAVAEAEALTTRQTAGTAVRSPASGLLTTSALRIGVSLEAAAEVAEVLQAIAGPPTVVVSLGSDVARVRTGMEASIVLGVAGTADSVTAVARITAASLSQAESAPLGTLGEAAVVDGTLLGAAGDNAAALTIGARGAATAELVSASAEFAAAAAQSPSSYECTARVITGSHRPIDRLFGSR